MKQQIICTYNVITNEAIQILYEQCSIYNVSTKWHIITFIISIKTREKSPSQLITNRLTLECKIFAETQLNVSVTLVTICLTRFLWNNKKMTDEAMKCQPNKETEK